MTKYIFLFFMIFAVSNNAVAEPKSSGLSTKSVSSLNHNQALNIPIITANALNGDTTYSLNVKILFLLAALTVLPALLMTMTAFTRIIIVFSMLRQALGIPNVPSNQIMVGLALILTIYVMMPTLGVMNKNCFQPYLAGNISDEVAITNAGDILKKFMLKQTRKADLNVFRNLAKVKISENDAVPFYILLPAYITSELKTAFQIGFLILLPFLIIDLVTASVLMSMGMMMLSPMVIALPFKIIFFVLVNGWTLIITSLVGSFRV
jgi:flagellar biosynthesis protein FliP